MTRRTIAFACSLLITSSLAVSAQTPSGSWKGRIEVPGSPLDITVVLGTSDQGRWLGAIDIPAQGMSSFPLTSIEIDGNSVTFAMPVVPGEPVFQGTIGDDGALISGEFRQSGNTMPFRLERTGDSDITTLLGPAVSAELAAALNGRWEGTLEVPGRTLRLAFVFESEAGADGATRLSAKFDSPDEGRTGMPVTGLTVDSAESDPELATPAKHAKATVRAELSYANAAYEGTLNDAGTALAGEWQQGGGALPLTLSKREASANAAFPQASPESQGIPAKALELLAEQVQGQVDREEIVGAELVVIKNRHSVFRQAFGWKDREAEQALEIDSIYCVRSMTKPFVGTAIQMLIDEGKLRLDTKVQDILPFFAGPETGKITIEHLLTHTGGFPFSILNKPLTEYKDLGAVAEQAAATELEFEPGARFEYSDTGSDTLGAIVAEITGRPVEQFLQERILDPLRMAETFSLIGDDDQVLSRIPVAYSGGTGAWSAHWRPSDPPIFPFFLSSQSLYSTTTDYARFLALWMDGGTVGGTIGERLLSPEAIERALTPRHQIPNYPLSLEDLDVYYGQQWMVYASSSQGDSQRRLFGHNGSDGTHAWAWPEEDLMVLYFTQSRGTTAGIGLEGMLHNLLVDHDFDDPSLMTRTPSSDELDQVAGIYWDQTADHAYYVLTPIGDRLQFERPGRTRLIFKADKEPWHFVHEANSRLRIEFQRSNDGAVTHMRTVFGQEDELDPRYVPDPSLPSAKEVIALVQQAHRIDRLPELGVVRLTGTVAVEKRNLEGPFTTLFDSARERTEMHFGALEQTVLKQDGRATTYSSQTGTEALEADRLQQAMLDRFVVRYGDWTQHYDTVEVMKRLRKGERSLLLVRVVPRNSPGATLVVDESTGRLVHMDSLEHLPGMGLVGVETDFADFREVGGMVLPFKTRARFQTPLIGDIATTLERAETDVVVSEEAFSVPDPSSE